MTPVRLNHSVVFAACLLFVLPARAEPELALHGGLGAILGRDARELVQQRLSLDAGWVFGRHAVGARLAFNTYSKFPLLHSFTGESPTASLRYRLTVHEDLFVESTLGRGSIARCVGPDICERPSFVAVSMAGGVAVGALGGWQLRASGGVSWQSIAMVSGDEIFKANPGSLLVPFVELSLHWQSGRAPPTPRRASDARFTLVLDGAAGVGLSHRVQLGGDFGFGGRLAWSRHVFGIEVRALEYARFDLQPALVYQHRRASPGGRTWWLEGTVGSSFPVLAALCDDCTGGIPWALGLRAGTELVSLGPVPIDVFGGLAVLGEDASVVAFGPHVGARMSWAPAGR